MLDTTHWVSVYMCALDFILALNERGRFLNWLFRLVVGRYAYREYEIMRAILEFDGYKTDLEYGLEGCEYHKLSSSEVLAEWSKDEN